MINEQTKYYIQILKKAIEIAVRRTSDKKLNIYTLSAFIDKNNKFRCSEVDMLDINGIIFSHDFAKAFWGIGRGEKEGLKRACYSPWKSSLQRMVLEEHPIKYLEDVVQWREDKNKIN